jgi:SAM-dependent methyltransferase
LQRAIAQLRVMLFSRSTGFVRLEMRSTSHQARGFVDTVREALGLAVMHWARRKTPISFDDLDKTMAEYEQYLVGYCGRKLTRARVFEIGFGARPFRLVWLYNNGVDVAGCDLDMPLLNGSALDIARKNGIVRAFKSAIRYQISDKAEWNALARAIRARGRRFEFPGERLMVADAAEARIWREFGPADLIYSEDVFEHIPKDNLRRILAHMASSLQPNGIALVRPMVFTGICGGHHLEWFPHTMDRTLANAPILRITEPWEHLRKNRHKAGTYLNGLSLAEYVALFLERFDILEQKVMRPDLGREFMTEEIRAELLNYDDSELYSNSVLFVLRPKRLRAGSVGNSHNPVGGRVGPITASGP